MHCVKRPGKRLMALTFERQGVEMPVHVAWLNRFTPPGRPSTMPVFLDAKTSMQLDAGPVGSVDPF